MCHFNQNRSMGERREMLESFIENTFKKYNIDKSIGILEKATSGLLMELSYNPVDIEDAVRLGAFKGLGEKRYHENQPIIDKLVKITKEQSKLLVSYTKKNH